jgi:hypothetical protein
MAGIGWAPLGGEWWTWRWCPLLTPDTAHFGLFGAALSPLWPAKIQVPGCAPRCVDIRCTAWGDCSWK